MSNTNFESTSNKKNISEIGEDYDFNIVLDKIHKVDDIPINFIKKIKPEFLFNFNSYHYHTSTDDYFRIFYLKINDIKEFFDSSKPLEFKNIPVEFAQSNKKFNCDLKFEAKNEKIYFHIYFTNLLKENNTNSYKNNDDFNINKITPDFTESSNKNDINFIEENKKKNKNEDSNILGNAINLDDNFSVINEEAKKFNLTETINDKNCEIKENYPKSENSQNFFFNSEEKNYDINNFLKNNPANFKNTNLDKSPNKKISEENIDNFYNVQDNDILRQNKFSNFEIDNTVSNEFSEKNIFDNKEKENFDFYKIDNFNDCENIEKNKIYNENNNNSLNNLNNKLIEHINQPINTIKREFNKNSKQEKDFYNSFSYHNFDIDINNNFERNSDLNKIDSNINENEPALNLGKNEKNKTEKYQKSNKENLQDHKISNENKIKIITEDYEINPYIKNNIHFQDFTFIKLEKIIQKKQEYLESICHDEIKFDIKFNLWNKKKNSFNFLKGQKLELKKLTKQEIEIGNYEDIIYDGDDYLIKIILSSKKKLKTANKEYSGISNEKNTCYLNSIFQTFFNLKILRKIIFNILSNEGSSTFLMQQSLYELQSLKPDVRLINFIRSMGWSEDIQNDITEILFYLFEMLSEEELKINSESKLQEYCMGTYSTNIKCSDVSYESKIYERFLFLSLDIYKCRNIIESIEKFISVEKLIEENKYELDDKTKHDAIRNISLNNLPPILFIQLKRFDFSTYAEKKFDRIEYEEFLDLHDYINLSDKEQENKPNISNKYELYGVVVHDGNSEGGHYFTFFKDEKSKQWIKYNDSKTSYADHAEVFEKNFGGMKKQIYINNNGEICEEYIGNSRTAYILVYISLDKKEEIFCDVGEKDISDVTLEFLKNPLDKINANNNNNNFFITNNRNSETRLRNSKIIINNNIFGNKNNKNIENNYFISLPNKENSLFNNDNSSKNSINDLYKNLGNGTTNLNNGNTKNKKQTSKININFNQENFKPVTPSFYKTNNTESINKKSNRDALLEKNLKNKFHPDVKNLKRKNLDNNFGYDTENNFSCENKKQKNKDFLEELNKKNKNNLINCNVEIEIDLNSNHTYSNISETSLLKKENLSNKNLENISFFSSNYFNKKLNDKSTIKIFKFKLFFNQYENNTIDISMNKSLGNNEKYIYFLQELFEKNKAYLKVSPVEVEISNLRLAKLSNLGIFIELINEESDINNLLEEFYKKNFYLMFYYFDFTQLLSNGEDNLVISINFIDNIKTNNKEFNMFDNNNVRLPLVSLAEKNILDKKQIFLQYIINIIKKSSKDFENVNISENNLYIINMEKEEILNKKKFQNIKFDDVEYFFFRFKIKKNNIIRIVCELNSYIL